MQEGFGLCLFLSKEEHLKAINTREAGKSCTLQILIPQKVCLLSTHTHYALLSKAMLLVQHGITPVFACEPCGNLSYYHHKPQGGQRMNRKDLLFHPHHRPGFANLASFCTVLAYWKKMGIRKEACRVTKTDRHMTRNGPWTLNVMARQLIISA